MHYEQIGFTSGMQGWLHIRKIIYTICYINNLRDNYIIFIDTKKAFDRKHD